VLARMKDGVRAAQESSWVPNPIKEGAPGSPLCAESDDLVRSFTVAAL
jgi:hypothetical protein